MPRLFIAVFNIPGKSDFEKLQEYIKRYTRAKIVEQKNIHITLSFLGNVDEKNVETIRNKLSNVCKNFEPFEVLLKGVKFIPSKKFVRVVALDVLSEEMKKLSSEIKKNVGGDVKPPHLTLARIKSIYDKEKLFEIEKIDFEKKFAVDSIQLMESTLTPKGPVYKILENFTLSKQHQ